MSKILQEILKNLPNSWAEISYTQYLELQECEADEELEGTELLIEQLSILLDTDSLDPIWDEISLEDFFSLTKSVNWLSRPPRAELLLEWKFYKFKPFNQLILGEFIDIEHFIGEGYAVAPKIAAILYRKNHYNDWGHRVWEPYEYDIEERAQDFISLPVNAVYGMFEEYRKWKENFMEKYDPLFEDTSEEPEGFVPQEMDAHERAEAKKAEAYDAARKQWSWENILWNLSNGDVSRFDGLFASNVILIFNVLAMRKVLDV